MFDCQNFQLRLRLMSKYIGECLFAAFRDFGSLVALFTWSRDNPSRRDNTYLCFTCQAYLWDQLIAPLKRTRAYNKPDPMDCVPINCKITKPKFTGSASLVAVVAVGLGTGISSFGLRSPSPKYISDPRLLVSASIEINQPFSHPEFSEKSFHSCTSNLLYVKPL